MVRQFVRGYGILILSSMGLLTGFFLYQQYKQDVLAYSLDLVGDRLIAMAPDDTNKDAILSLYESFKQRVLAREVPPRQVEHVAANILNLGNSGATVTSEQAEAILEPPRQAVSYEDSAQVLQAVYHADPDHFEAVGRRIAFLCEFDKKIRTIVKNKLVQGGNLERRIHYECEDGLRLVVDTEINRMIPQDEFQQLAMNLQPLEKEKMVIWKENLAAELHKVRQRVKEEMQSLGELQEMDIPETPGEIKRLKVLKGLADYDFHFDEAAFEEALSRRLKKMEENLERLNALQDKKSKS